MSEFLKFEMSNTSSIRMVSVLECWSEQGKKIYKIVLVLNGNESY